MSDEDTLRYPSTKDFDDRNHNISQICEENGFGFRRYNVTTEDGYILSLDRIPPLGKDADSDFEAPVVLLQHGIEDSSIQWVINSPEKALGFVLSRAGYDVWLGNNRGNMMSRGHVNLTAKQKEYWDFDFEEMGTQDVPAFINFILNKTEGKNKIGKLAAYVGHSEGTSQFFIGSSLMPEFYKEKVNLFVALAPIVRLDHSTNKLMVYAAPIYPILQPLVQATGFYSLIDQGATAKFLGSSFCKVVPHFCIALNEGFFDFHGKIDNSARWADKMAHSPAGAGWRTLAHYAQIIKNKRFQRWDYGADENNKRYGQPTAPDYDLSKIEVPLAIAHGDVDQLSDLQDVAWLLDESQSGLRVKEHLVQLKQYHFGHNSFSMSIDGTWFPRDFMPVIAEQCGNCLDN